MQVLAISSDSVKTLKKFRKERGQDVVFISDPKGELILRYDVKTPLVTFAQRTSFVIDQAGIIRAVFTGNDAIDEAPAFAAAQRASRLAQ